MNAGAADPAVRNTAGDPPPTVHARHFDSPPEPAVERASNWGSAPWTDCATIFLAHCAGPPTEHRPNVAARVGWDADAIYLQYRVEDAYVRAVAERHQDAVWNDSCVEFYFTPGESVDAGYFNLEVNCGGTMLLNYQPAPRQGLVDLSPEALAGIDIQRTLPRIVDPEIREPVTWAIEVRLPFDSLQPYMPFQRPTAGTRWRVNFCKCGDETSHPHWLTWAPIDCARPDFHVPAAFGTLVFD